MTTREQRLRDERLEEVSDQIRKGIPVNFQDAIAAIDYQNMLRDNRKQRDNWLRRMWNKLKEPGQ
jgi:hypothetical protein